MYNNDVKKILKKARKRAVASGEDSLTLLFLLYELTIYPEFMIFLRQVNVNVDKMQAYVGNIARDVYDRYQGESSVKDPETLEMSDFVVDLFERARQFAAARTRLTFHKVDVIDLAYAFATLDNPILKKLIIPAVDSPERRQLASFLLHSCAAVLFQVADQERKRRESAENRSISPEDFVAEYDEIQRLHIIEGIDFGVISLVLQNPDNIDPFPEFNVFTELEKLKDLVIDDTDEEDSDFPRLATIRIYKTQDQEEGDEGTNDQDRVRLSLDALNEILSHREDDMGDLFSSSSSSPKKQYFSTDLVELAKKGKLDPVIGRKSEIERGIQVLLRRKKNNPVFVGPPGAGKTAIVNGLAQRIADGDVPEKLKNATIFSLDITGLVSGCRYRGDFEERMKRLISSLLNIENAILFVDELHMAFGAGDREQGLDFVNILKPYLADGSLSLIGATTHDDFRRSIDKDHAFLRRIQKIEVSEPSQEDVIEIVKGILPTYEKYHGVKFTDEAIATAVSLSNAHIPQPANPDKTIDLIDEIGSRYASYPDRFESNTIDVPEVRTIISKIAKLPHIQSQTDQRAKYLSLEDKLKERIFGQDEAIKHLTTVIKLKQAGLQRHDRPTASLLFAGPTGVGKTELAKQTALLLNLPFLRFDMSEYKEWVSVTKFIGTSPGYIGFERGGILTNAINDNPNCVLLLDEVEKAHPDVLDVLLQVMDAGRLTDNTGKTANFKNVILIMTSNVGADTFNKGRVGFDRTNDASLLWDEKAFHKMFTPEFRNRLDHVVVFNSLGTKDVERVVDKFIKETELQLAEHHLKIELTQAARAYLAEKGYDPKMGARPLDRILQQEIKIPLADALLRGTLDSIGNIFVDVVDGELTLKMGSDESAETS